MALSLADWRDPVTDRVGHEAGHAAGLIWLGYSADRLRLDFKHADFGFAGKFDGVRRVSGDEKREAYDRATIAALGPWLGGESLDDRSSAGDLRCIDLNVTDNWPIEAWRMLATDRARDLARHEPFRRIWRSCVLALRDLGDRYVELHGEQVDRFLAELPDATSFRVGEPRLEVANLRSASGVYIIWRQGCERGIGGLRSCLPSGRGSPPCGGDLGGAVAEISTTLLRVVGLGIGAFLARLRLLFEQPFDSLQPPADLCNLWIQFGSARAPDARGVPVWDASVAAL